MVVIRGNRETCWIWESALARSGDAGLPHRCHSALSASPRSAGGARRASWESLRCHPDYTAVANQTPLFNTFRPDCMLPELLCDWLALDLISPASQWGRSSRRHPLSALQDNQGAYSMGNDQREFYSFSYCISCLLFMFVCTPWCILCRPRCTTISVVLSINFRRQERLLLQRRSKIHTHL